MDHITALHHRIFATNLVFVTGILRDRCIIVFLIIQKVKIDVSFPF